MTSPQEKFVIIRRAVSIAGRVSDALTGAPIAGAVVEISDGPDEFKTIIATLRANPAWERQTERLNRRLTRPDGWYAFSDLPTGSYSLAVSAPQLGTRYKALTLASVVVTNTREPSGRVAVARANAALQPTRIKGRITRNGGQPVVAAKVRLRGDINVVLTDDDGRYVLSGLVVGKPVVEVTAKNFQVFTSSPVNLNAGDEKTVDAVLTPA